MNFKSEKIQSIQLLKIVFAVLISAMPALLGLTGEIGFYAMLLVLCALLSYRVYDSKKIYMPISSMMLSIFFIYNFISLLWAKDRAGHLTYLTLVVAFVMFSALFADYLNKNSDAGLDARIMYMLCVSSFFVALVNTGVWFLKYIPEGKAYCFSAGFNSNAELGIFMILTLICMVVSLRRTGKRRKTLVFTAIAALFTVIMAKSIVPIIFAAILLAIYLLRNKGKKTYFLMIMALTIGFIVSFIINCTHNIAFSDALRVGITHPLGIGGGGFNSGMQSYASKYYTKADVGLIALVTSASGILGLIFCLSVAIRQMLIAVKNRTWLSVATYIITLFMLINPYRGEVAPMLMWVALVTYNEGSLKPISSITISKDRIKKIVAVLLILSVLCAMAICETAMKKTAHSLYKNKDYLGAYSWYKVTATINPIDDESCAMASASLRKSGAIKEHEEEAVKYADMAVKRNKNNVENLALKARVFTSCERYDRAIAQWETCISSAPHNDCYRLEFAKVLYKVIKANEKGSSDTKEMYKKLHAISEATTDLDTKKEINDIADKALGYTKGELKDEGEAES